jgi:hypothetical protein
VPCESEGVCGAGGAWSTVAVCMESVRENASHCKFPHASRGKADWGSLGWVMRRLGWCHGHHDDAVRKAGRSGDVEEEEVWRLVAMGVNVEADGATALPTRH